ncbi:GNAT family N-acetyltransferase [Nocardioides acrostichi]|uniref:GNAT family N-acetyltransferase n=1 Tax=Nocardioides acrostichi TaxID=2784339 RepID=A0A930UZS6_9ACTN|nr:GNAT family N-acetyltransferase [Nocardioides acrostichi]MBF4163061.1 GNAT family N-acetyltransferase [Nocardioides acrostichi]
MSVEFSPLVDGELGDWGAQARQRDLLLRQLPMTGEDAALAPVAESRTHQRFAARLVDGRPGPGQVVEEVRLEGRPAGWVWLGQASPDELEVLDLALTDPADASAVRTRLEQRCRDHQVRRLVLTMLPADPAHRAFAAAGPMDPVATRMRLDLTDPPGTTRGPVTLRSLSAAGTDAYLGTAVQRFAATLRRDSPWLDESESLAQSHATHARILPRGAATPGHAFLAPEVDGERVGTLWVSLCAPAGYVYDVRLDAERRGRGLGRATMDAGAAWCQARGVRALGLNVFAYNDTARALYDSLGYQPVECGVVVPIRPRRG